MKKIELYTGDKTYMFPNGDIATKDKMLASFPAVLAFPHIIETDEAGEVAFAVQNLSAMCSLYNINMSLTTEEKVAKLEEIVNTVPEVDNSPSTDERIAAALEAQVMMSLPNDTTTETTDEVTEDTTDVSSDADSAADDTAV